MLRRETVQEGVRDGCVGKESVETYQCVFDIGDWADSPFYRVVVSEKMCSLAS